MWYGGRKGKEVAHEDGDDDENLDEVDGGDWKRARVKEQSLEEVDGGDWKRARVKEQSRAHDETSTDTKFFDTEEDLVEALESYD